MVISPITIPTQHHSGHIFHTLMSSLPNWVFNLIIFWDISERYFKLKRDQIVSFGRPQESDAKEYLALGKSIMSENIYSLTQADELTLTIEEEIEWIQSNLKKPHHLILVAEVNRKIVGQLDFSNGHRKRIEHTGEFGMGIHNKFRNLESANIYYKSS